MRAQEIVVMALAVVNTIGALFMAYIALSLKNSSLQSRLDFTNALQGLREELTKALAEAVRNVSDEHVRLEVCKLCHSQTDRRLDTIEKQLVHIRDRIDGLNCSHET